MMISRDAMMGTALAFRLQIRRADRLDPRREPGSHPERASAVSRGEAAGVFDRNGRACQNISYIFQSFSSKHKQEAK